MPEYSIDYCFPGDELGYKWTVLAGRERINKSWVATTVPMKGGSGRFAVDKVLEFIKENGDASRDIIVKSDQEPSMKYLVKDLLEQRSEGRTVVEESPKKSSGSNGVVERGVLKIENQIRAIFVVKPFGVAALFDLHPKWCPADNLRKGKPLFKKVQARRPKGRRI